MRAASAPRVSGRLLHVDVARGTFRDTRAAELPSLLAPGDLVVVNDSATLPASLRAETPSGAEVEVRLAADLGRGRWRAALFGAGDWRTPTERRADAEPARELRFGGGLRAAVESREERLATLAFDREGSALWAAIYALGRPVQYSYLSRDLALAEVQTSYAARPWGVEMPSAGRPLTWEMRLALRSRGVRVASLTHAAGLSSIGDEALDAALPMPERYEIPEATVRAIDQAGGKVIAVGTTVVRALEGAAVSARGLVPGEGVTDLVIGPGFVPRVVDGILTGMHEPTASHFSLLSAFAPRELLLAAHLHAEGAGYLAHEFGDAALIA